MSTCYECKKVIDPDNCEVVEFCDTGYRFHQECASAGMKKLLEPKEEKKEETKKKGHNTPTKEFIETCVEYMMDDSEIVLRFWKTIPDKRHKEPCDFHTQSTDNFKSTVFTLMDKLRIYHYVELEVETDRGQTWKYKEEDKVWLCKMDSETKWTRERCGPPDITNAVNKLTGRPEDPKYIPALSESDF